MFSRQKDNKTQAQQSSLHLQYDKVQQINQMTNFNQLALSSR